MASPARWLAVALIALSTPAFAGEPISVIEPANGAVLRGGETATITWKATGPLRKGVVEWEAFLSVDGGRYFSTRITPHLDIDIRTFEWRVPNVSSNDVRLLLRVGDEIEETSVDVPLRFSILAEPKFRPSNVRFARERGESARPGDPSVIEWATGDRGGTEVAIERAPLGDAIDTARQAHATTKHSAVEHHDLAKWTATIASAHETAIPPRARGSSPLFARDILLLVRRLNL